MLSSLDKQKYSGDLLQNLSGLQYDGNFCDVVLIADRDRKRISAHRVILAAASEFFKVMFTGRMMEARRPDVTIRETDGDILLLLIKYCYTAEIDINIENIEHLMTAAAALQLTHVVDKCAGFVEINLHPTNCLGVAAMAEVMQCDFLARRAHEVMAEQYLTLMDTIEFHQLSFERLAALVNRCDLQVNSEMDVLVSITNWVIYNRADRIPKFPMLLRSVRRPLLPLWMINTFVLPICQQYKLEKMLDEALAWHRQRERFRKLPRPVSLQYIPRKAQNGLLAIFSRYNNLMVNFEQKDDLCVEHYCTESSKWKSFGSIHSRRSNFGTVCTNGIIIIAGGCRDNCEIVYKTVIGFNLSGKTAKELSPMLHERFGLALAIVEGLVYAVGGDNGEEVLDCVECFDPVLGGPWKTVATMTTARANMALASMGGRLYAVGGCVGKRSLVVTEVYEPHKDKWTRCASMLQPRTKFTIAGWNGFLYAVGGVNSSAVNMVERYDPRVDKWIDLLDMGISPYSIGSHIKCGYMYIVMSMPASDDTKRLISVEKYSVNMNTLTNQVDRTLNESEAKMDLTAVVALP